MQHADLFGSDFKSKILKNNGAPNQIVLSGPYSIITIPEV